MSHGGREEPAGKSGITSNKKKGRRCELWVIRYPAAWSKCPISDVLSDLFPYLVAICDLAIGFPVCFAIVAARYDRIFARFSRKRSTKQDNVYHTKSKCVCKKKTRQSVICEISRIKGIRRMHFSVKI